MPVVASGVQQAWVRVPPKKKKVKVEQTDTLLGPLSYFSCRPDISNDRLKSSKELIIPKYTSEIHSKYNSRAVSAPQPRWEGEDDDDEIYVEEDRSFNNRRNMYERPITTVSRVSHSQSRPRHLESNTYSYERQRPPPAPSRQYRDMTPRRAQYSNNTTISSSWMNATRPLDLG